MPHRSLIAAFIMLAACRSSTTPAPAFDVTVQLASPTVAVGRSVGVTVTVKNVGSSTFDLNVGSCPEPFIVTTSDGAVVGPAARGCLLILRIRELAPGESYSYDAQFAGSGLGSGDLGGTPLPPGSYLIRGRVAVAGAFRQSAAAALEILP